MSVHDLGEGTKRTIDFASFMLAGVALTLSQVALIISCVAGLLSITWYAIRIYDRLNGGTSND